MYSSLRTLVLAAGLALATTSYADFSSLDPENFLDPQQDQTFAMIAQELQALASGSSTTLLLDESMASLTPAVIVIAAAPADDADFTVGLEFAAAEPSVRDNEMETLAALAAAEPSVRDNEMETLAALVPAIAEPSVETTGSLSKEADQGMGTYTIGDLSDDYMP